MRKILFQNIAVRLNFPLSSLSLITILVVTCTVGIIAWRWWKQKKYHKSLHSLPSPPKHWLLGNIPQLLAAIKQIKLFKLIFECSQELEPIYVYWIGI